MQLPGVWIETLDKPQLYADWQIEQACAVAHMLKRGKFVLTVKPAR